MLFLFALPCTDLQVRGKAHKAVATCFIFPDKCVWWPSSLPPSVLVCCCPDTSIYLLWAGWIHWLPQWAKTESAWPRLLHIWLHCFSNKVSHWNEKMLNRNAPILEVTDVSAVGNTTLIYTCDHVYRLFLVLLIVFVTLFIQCMRGV